MNRAVRKLALTVLVITVWSSVPVRSQEMIDLTASLGAPEFLSAGFRLNMKQVQLGFNAGTLPVTGGKIFTASLNLYFHFAGNSKYTYLKPWYAMAGINWLTDEEVGFNLDKYLFLNLRAGRELNLSPRAALGLDGGLLFKLYYDRVEYTPPSPWFPSLPMDASVQPSLAITFIYRIIPRSKQI